MCGGGGIGGILGGLGGLGLDLFAPELGIPLALATGGGSFLGSTLGGVASGEKFGKAALGGLESGALSGGLSGLGELATTGNFLGSFGGGAGDAAGAGAADASAAGSTALPGVTGTQLASAASPTAVSDTVAAAPAAAPSTAGLGAAAASSAGAGGPADLAAINTAAAGNPSLAGGVSNALTSSAGNADVGTPDILYGTGYQSYGGSGLPGDIGGNITTGPSQGFLQDAGSSALNFAKSNPGLLLGGGGILASLLMNNSIPGLSNLQSQESTLQNLGAQNLRAGQTGQIPGGEQAQLDAAERAAEASTRSQFSREGIAGSTMENQSLVGDQIAEAAAKNQIINQIMSQGAAELGSAGTLATSIMNTELAQNKDVQTAIGQLAAALAGSSGLKAAAV